MAAFCLASAGPAVAANLVVNGDFEAGNSGFSSHYTHYTGTETYASNGLYYLTSNPNSVCGCFASFGDHTSGSGQMLGMDGAEDGGAFWSETIAVAPNSHYDFSYYAAEFGNGGAFANIAAYLDGSQIGTTLTPQFAAWTPFTAGFDTGAGTNSITLELRDLDTSYLYNDFGVDDVALNGPAVAGVPEPATWALLLGGFGLVGAAAHRRNRGTAAYA